MPVLWFTCDEEIADLITLMNYCGIRTINSCQDNRLNRGHVPRVRAEILAENLLSFLSMLDRPDEVSDLESISHRMATEFNPADRADFQEDRAWHYRTSVDRKRGQPAPLMISIRFPCTDLPQVVTLLRTAARELTGPPPEDTPHDRTAHEQFSGQYRHRPWCIREVCMRADRRIARVGG